MLIRINGKEPDRPFYVSENVSLIGDVRLGSNVSIWFNSVLRADIKHIAVGDYSNIQDACALHVTEELPVEIGRYVTVGHGVVLHGCSIDDYVLIGMGSTVLDNAKIGKGCIIAAGTVVKENAVIPPYSLVAGVPGTIKRQLDGTVIEQLKMHAEHYVKYAENMKNAELMD